MMSFRMSFFNLLGLFLIFSENSSGHSMDTVLQSVKLNISHLQNVNDKQSLMVSWLVNHSDLVQGIYEIQISRTENHTIIYNENVTATAVDLDEHTWTWSSDVPLECVDHSVRIRHFYDHSVPSPWSNWVTNKGAEVKDKTEIFPFQRVLREGTSAVFCCVPPRGVNITSMDYHYEHRIINTGTRVKAIAVDNLTIPKRYIKALSVSCNDSTGNIVHAWNYVSFPSEKPRNLSCVTSDMETVICTWDPGRKRDPCDKNKQTQTLHIVNSDQAPISCVQSSCKFPAVPQLEEYNISVVVRDQLGEETESYSFNIFDRVFPVVEWNRVSPGATNATVSWIVLGNLIQLDILCQVSTDPGKITSLSCRNKSSHCKVKLEHLLPNTRYSTRVRCSVNSRLWGEWTHSVFFTTYPLVTLDVWRRIKQVSYLHSRQVTLFWTPHIVGTAATVKIQRYTVQWSQEGQNGTRWKDSRMTQADVSIGPGHCEFTVKAVLHTGFSIPAHITIPRKDDKENLLVEKQLGSSSVPGFNLSWEEQSTATCGYTVEWCILGNAVPCTLRWVKMLEGNTTLFLPARHFKAGCRYTFNVYGCTENGHRLLEIQTGYSQELESVQPLCLVEPVQSTSSSVTLEWLYNENDPAHLAFITGYLVTWQEVLSDRQPGHTANVFNKSVKDPHSKSVTVEGLQQGHEYNFSVSALTKEGPGQAARIIIRTRANYSVHLAKILTPILLLLGCTILLWPQRRMLKRGLKEIFAYPAGMHIKTPELDSFLDETDQWLQSQKVEECISCDIEILNTRPPLNKTTRKDPELLNTPCSSASQCSTSSFSPSCEPLQADYYPQSATLLWETQAQITCIANKTYLNITEKDWSEPQQVASSEITSFDPSECLQESCSVIYGYISNETF
ncbi:oncostatin-M-specific receptor subunit beta [Scomber scombrus]|uniref:oncostatin-M-specific receptor subunit beta n=1 Tax=Scomber scombrus TaxID=13677 RepID=UPI002DDA88B4|nr:oncostatin-M-specific receptor subunit beta [Scomber scombrus]